MEEEEWWSEGYNLGALCTKCDANNNESRIGKITRVTEIESSAEGGYGGIAF